MKEIDLKQIKSMEELKKELGSKYDEVMYKMNLELLDRMDKAVVYIDNNLQYRTTKWSRHYLLKILRGSDKE